MNQDYIRTARSKGLTERTVIMRHAFRNALIPLATIVPIDIITLLGGAIITETVFGWSGMGRLFVDSLTHDQQIDPVMAYIVIVAILAVIANFVADLIYAVLDPRIRVAHEHPVEPPAVCDPDRRPTRTRSSCARSRASRRARSSGAGSCGTAAR